MRRMSCKCKCEHFKVHPKQGMVQCMQCGQRFEWKGEWKAMIMSKPRQIIRAVREAINFPVEWTQAKAIHPKKEKISRKVAFNLGSDEFPIKRTKSADIEKRIKARWRSEIK